MRIISTLVKVIIGIAIAIPLASFVFATTLGLLGAMLALAFPALKLAVAALAGVPPRARPHATALRLITSR